jgi:hypothetical protein
LFENKSSGSDSPESRSPVCPECKRLWKVYALATRKSLDAIMAKDAAAQQHDVATTKILHDKALEATQWWELARKAIRDHAATHTGEEPEMQE